MTDPVKDSSEGSSAGSWNVPRRENMTDVKKVVIMTGKKTGSISYISSGSVGNAQLPEFEQELEKDLAELEFAWQKSYKFIQVRNKFREILERRANSQVSTNTQVQAQIQASASSRVKSVSSPQADSSSREKHTTEKPISVEKPSFEKPLVKSLPIEKPKVESPLIEKINEDLIELTHPMDVFTTREPVKTIEAEHPEVAKPLESAKASESVTPITNEESVESDLDLIYSSESEDESENETVPTDTFKEKEDLANIVKLIDEKLETTDRTEPMAKSLSIEKVEPIDRTESIPEIKVDTVPETVPKEKTDTAPSTDTDMKATIILTGVKPKRIVKRNT